MNKNILVVGPTAGLGEAVASEFQYDDWAVCVMGRDPQATAALASEAGYAHVSGDVTDYGSLVRAAEDVRDFAGEAGLDAVVNCTGAQAAGNLRDLDPEVITRVAMVNTVGPMLVVKAFESLVAEGEGGRIVTTTSAVSSFGPNERNGVYGATKAGASSFLASHSKAARRIGVSLTDFAPGALENDMADHEGNRTMTEGGLSYRDAARLILSICNLPAHVDVPVLGAHSLHRWRSR